MSRAAQPARTAATLGVARHASLQCDANDCFGEEISGLQTAGVGCGFNRSTQHKPEIVLLASRRLGSFSVAH
jgi:hypothetical protein